MPRRRASDWRPGASLPTLKVRARMLRRVRAFFDARGVMEVETPLAGSAFGTDPSIEPLVTYFQGPGYAEGRALYLQSSPEFFMKRLLADGSGPIYQLCKAFRNGEAGRHHNPEFSILEWYRPGLDAAGLMDELSALLRELADQPRLPETRLSYRELFLQVLDIDPLEADVAALAACARQRNLLGAETMRLDRDGWLNLLMSSFIEPDLGRDGLCYVTDYPASQASLARLNPHEPRTAARFELYWKGLELANGFEELADAAEQSERFEHENCQRYRSGQRPMPVDDALLSALEHGMPDCAGVAVGMDRVLMCLLDLEDIDQALGFSLARV